MKNENFNQEQNNKPNNLFRQFAKVNWLMHRYMQQNRRAFGPMGDTTRGQGRILALLKIQPAMSQRELAYLLGMRPQSVGELLGKLERAGYVTRTQSETDKRVMNVELTDAGRKAAEERVEVAEPFAALTAEEQANLSDYLKKIAASLKEQLRDGEEDEAGSEGRRGRGFGRGQGRGRGGRPGGPWGIGGDPRGEYFDARVRLGFAPRFGFAPRRGGDKARRYGRSMQA